MLFFLISLASLSPVSEQSSTLASQVNDAMIPAVSDLTSHSFALSDLQLPPLLLVLFAIVIGVPVLSAVLKSEEVSESALQGDIPSAPLSLKEESTPTPTSAEVEALKAAKDREAAVRAEAMSKAKEEADRKYAENQARSAQLAAERRRREEEERARAEAERLERLKAEEEAKAAAKAARDVAIKQAQLAADQKYAENHIKSLEVSRARKAAEEAAAKKAAEEAAAKKAAEEAAAKKAAEEAAAKKAAEEAAAKKAAEEAAAKKAAEEAVAKKAAEEAVAKKAAEEAAAKKAAEEALALKKATEEASTGVADAEEACIIEPAVDEREIEAEEAEAIRASEELASGGRGGKRQGKQRDEQTPQEEASSNVAKLADMIAQSQKAFKGDPKDQFEDTIIAIERAAQLTYPDKSEEEVFALLDEPITLLAKLPIIKYAGWKLSYIGNRFPG